MIVALCYMIVALCYTLVEPQRFVEDSLLTHLQMQLRGSDESTIMRCSPKFLKIIKVMESYAIVSEEW